MAKDESLPAPLAAPAIPGARIALTLLVLINLFNYIDRQVLAAVEPEIRRELLGGLAEEDAKFYMGLLATAFLVSYMALAPLFGYLADRYSRWALVGFGVVLWSLATGTSGLPWNSWGVAAGTAFTFLLITRCFVGVGEAAYGPVAPAMIADLFPLKKRGMVLAFFYLALPVGGALGYALGEAVIRGQFAAGISGLGSMIGRDWTEASKHLSSWHWAFFLVVPPGMLLGIWCFLKRDPPKGRTDAVVVVNKKLSVSEILGVLRIPSYTLNTIGMTFMSFAIGGLAYWMSDFLEKRQVEPLFGRLAPRTTFGIIIALAGLLSTLSGGIVGDLLRLRFSGSYFLVSGFALIVGVPMVLGMVYVPFPGAWIFVFMAVFCLFFNAGPTNTILANVIHPSIRGSAYALNILIIHLFGDAISPPLIGWISGKEHLERGFILVAVVMGLGGIAWLFGARYLENDTKLAPTRL
jgi:MFS transporter, Spinster family, sphingosine-1-phosphate transporter